jgi:hypothetical protein
MIINSNNPTGASAIRGESDKANSPAIYTISAIPANRPSVVNSFIGLLINHVPRLKLEFKNSYVK